MNRDKFWRLIAESRQSADDCVGLAKHLFETLKRLEPPEILSFQQQMWQRLAESYRWDLWAVAYIVNGGCSDDGFEYFRGWLIAQGCDYFEAALRDPESAAIRAEPDANECEDILYVAPRAYQEATGQSLPLDSFIPRTSPL